MDLTLGAGRIRFFRSLADSAQSGLSPLRALEIMAAGQTGLPAAALEDLARRVKAGGQFSEALQAHPEEFPAWQAEIVAVGESTGRLDVALLRVAEALEERRAFVMNLLPGLAYPLVVLHFAPFALNSSKIITEGAASYLASVALFLLWVYVPAGLLAWAWRKGWLPLKALPFASSVSKMRFCYFLAAMLKAGVNFSRALELSARAAGLEPKAGPPEPGASVLEHLRRYQVFSAEELARIEVAELSGKVDEGLSRLAEQARENWQATLRSLAALLPPLLYILIAAVLGYRIVTFWSKQFSGLTTVGM